MFWIYIFLLFQIKYKQKQIWNNLKNFEKNLYRYYLDVKEKKTTNVINHFKREIEICKIVKNTIQSIYYEQINPPFQVWFQNSRARDRRESKIPPLVPLANPASQTTYEQPLDLSKKEGLAESVRKDSNAACVKFASSSPVEQRNDNASSHNQDADDLEDSPLVIDEETTDSVETKRTVPTGEIVPKVMIF